MSGVRRCHTGDEARRRDNAIIGAKYSGTQPANGFETVLFLMSPWHNSSTLETLVHYLMMMDAGAA
jgi:hypothetical protein